MRRPQLSCSTRAARTRCSTTTLGAETPTSASVTGSEGRLEIDEVWYQPTSFTLRPVTGAAERFAEPRVGHGLRYQAEEVGRCLRAGATESPIMPLDESLAIMTTMDEIRRQIGLRYPFEDPERTPDWRNVPQHEGAADLC